MRMHLQIVDWLRSSQAHFQHGEIWLQIEVFLEETHGTGKREQELKQWRKVFVE